MSVRQLFTVILLLGMFGFSVRVARDPDLWWHLKTGEYILEEGIPRQDPSFSFVVPEDRRWVTHEWLTQVFMYGVYNRLGGQYGLSLVFAALIVLTFGILYYASDGKPYLAGFAAFWGICASLPFLNARPQMFNILFGAIIILVVEAVKKRGWSPQWFWLFPVLHALWVNMHGGYLLGLVVMGVYVVGEGAQLFLAGGHDEGLDFPKIRLLAIVGVLSFLAALINPNGYQMWIYAFETLSSDAMRDVILEWKSPNFHLWYMWFFGFMMFATWGVMIYSKRPVIWSDFLFIIGTSFAGLQSVRNIPLFAMVAVPVLSRHLVGIVQETRFADFFLGEPRDDLASPVMKRLNWVVAGLVVIGIGAYIVETLGRTEEVTRLEFPVEAVEFIKAEGLDQARIYNDYEWGGYLIWEEIPTFIDGRADLFGDELIWLYMTTLRRQEGWRDALDDYDVEYILTRKNGDFAVFAEAVPEWEPYYEDGTSIIFERAN